jgi:hypothetical protein
MTNHSLFLSEFLLFNGAAVAWAVWEFWKIRPWKPDKGDGSETSAMTGTPRDAGPSPQKPGHPEG